MSDLEKNVEKAKIVKEYLDKEMPELNPLEKNVAVMITALGGNPTEFIAEALSIKETEKAEARTPKPEFPEDYTPVERAIAEMLTENTGAHILDSGGIYGRHWEENRRIGDFRKLPPTRVTVWDDGMVEICVNIFHYLTAFLDIDEFSEKLQREFDEFEKKPEYRDYSWLEVMEEFADYVCEKYGFEAYGPWNSYNWENLLSQVIQGITLKGEDSNYVILQIHNGCDVRGGYTEPRIFKIVDLDHFVMAQSDVWAMCKCGSVYSDDCGYHWYDYNGDCDAKDLMNEWKPEPKFPNAENWEYQLRCRRCGEIVKFHSFLENYR
jgi:hypothetical protein